MSAPKGRGSANVPAQQSQNKRVQKSPNFKQGNSWVGDLTYPIRDVFIESLGKGQFIAAGIIFFIGLFFYRLPANELSSFFNSLLDRLEVNNIWGWCLFVLAMIGWFIHYKLVSRGYARELNRALHEKEELQSKFLDIINKKN